MAIDQAAQSPKSNRSPTWPKLPSHTLGPIHIEPSPLDGPSRTMGCGGAAPAYGANTTHLHHPPTTDRCSRDRMGRWGQSARRRRGQHAGARNGEDLVTRDLRGMALPPVIGGRHSIKHLVHRHRTHRYALRLQVVLLVQMHLVT